MIRGLAALAALVAAAPSVAQTSRDEQLWLNLSLNGTLSEGVPWQAEVQPRWDKGMSRHAVLLFRLAAGKRIAKNVTVWQGYVHQKQYQDGADRNEERSYQQLNWQAATGRWGSLQFRTRFEQRWFSNGNDMGLRARQQVRYEKPLGTSDRAVVAVATGELFFNLRDTDYGARDGFEASRTFAGLRVPLSDRHSVEAGYLAQYSDDSAPGAALAHILSVTLTARP
jgi:hypothetical protein